MPGVVQADPHDGAGAGKRGSEAEAAGIGDLGQVPGCERVANPVNATGSKERSVNVGGDAGE
ncbi:hypothetical protein D9M72_373780 [compost metagenome]